MLYESMGMNQTSFAHLIGVGQSAMSNYQGGTRRPDPDVAITIQMKTGATLDWIYTGERGGLPGNLLQKLPDWDETLPERRPAKPRKR